MASVFYTFPQFNPKVHNIFDISSPYIFTYQSNTGRESLRFDEEGVLIEPDEKYGEDWNIDIHISRTIKVRNASILYGENGIANKDAKIGLCVIWTSPSSGQRGVYRIGIVENKDEEQVLQLDALIEKSSIRDKIDFSLSLYIHEPASTHGESYKANKKGMILGNVEIYTLTIDTKPDFPIYNVSIPGGPLWDIECNWTSINDPFLDVVSIYFNKANKQLYAYVDKTNDKKFDINLVREILGSALIQIIQKYQETDPNFTQLDNAIPGSVADYVRKYIHEWNVDTSSLNIMSSQLRRNLEQKIQTLA